MADPTALLIYIGFGAGCFVQMIRQTITSGKMLRHRKTWLLILLAAIISAAWPIHAGEEWAKRNLK